MTEGIQHPLTAREPESVIAHEMAPVPSRDVLIASVATMPAGAISAIVGWLQFSLLFGCGEGPLGLVGTLGAMTIASLAATCPSLASAGMGPT